MRLQGTMENLSVALVLSQKKRIQTMFSYKGVRPAAIAIPEVAIARGSCLMWLSVSTYSSGRS